MKLSTFRYTVVHTVVDLKDLINQTYSVDLTDCQLVSQSVILPGAWMRKGLGTVASVDGRLLWTFRAPHLGYWIAASFPSTRGKGD